MRANEFVKEFGWDEAKSFVNKTIELYGAVSGLHYASNGYISVLVPHLVRDFDVSISELKRLVEAHELVSDYYGLTRAKEHAESNYTAPELRDALKQSIADVESCQ